MQIFMVSNTIKASHYDKLLCCCCLCSGSFRLLYTYICNVHTAHSFVHAHFLITTWVNCRAARSLSVRTVSQFDTLVQTWRRMVENRRHNVSIIYNTWQVTFQGKCKVDQKIDFFYVDFPFVYSINRSIINKRKTLECKRAKEVIESFGVWEFLFIEYFCCW